MRGIRCFVCLIVLVASVFAADTPKPQSETAAAGAPKPDLPNMVLITMDTTRADRMGFLGSKRGLTPNLDILARDSAVFTRAYSQAPLTPTSHASILTGTFPQYHQVLTFPIPLAVNMPDLPETLQKHGYATAAFVGSIALDSNIGAPGFNRGFDTYDAGFTWAGFKPKTRYQTVERRAGEVVQRAITWLNEHQKSPFFLWVHVYDAHDPYDPPMPFKARYSKAPYDGEIAYVDSSLGKLFRQLKTLGVYDNTIITVTADHGESLGAHGEDEHGIFVYDETIHVPLLVKLTRRTTKGKRVEDRVELVDIMPTLLGTADIAVPEKVQGQSLLGLIEPDTPAGTAAAKLWKDRGAYSRADYGHLSFGWSTPQALRTGKYLYVEAPRRELYQDAIDPDDKNNLASSSAAVADTLSGRVKDFLQATSNTDKTPKSKMDEAKARQLQALGYMPTRGDSDFSEAQKGADPKDKIKIANVMVRVNDILQNERCGPGVPALKKALKSYPEISMLHFFLGGCYMEALDFENAVTELKETVRLDPIFTKAELNLGRALMRTNHYDEAETAFEHVAKASPNDINAHTFLIILYSKADRFQDVIKECKAVLHYLPDNYGANVHLGQALLKTGDAEGAIAPLQLAIAGEPDKAGPHGFLADAYQKLGREEDAQRERAEAKRLATNASNPMESAPTNQPEDNMSQ